jgi:hypothetical protein
MLFELEKLLQPYCNRAGTDAYVVDTPTLINPQNSWKMAEFVDGLVQARIHHSRLLISRFQVRVLGGSHRNPRSLPKFDRMAIMRLYRTRQFAKKHGVSDSRIGQLLLEDCISPRQKLGNG